MYFYRKKRFKPLFKQIIKLRGNIQNRKKLLKFRRKKWGLTIKFYRNKTRDFKNYIKFKPLDQTKYYVTKYSSRGTDYQKKFRDKLNASKTFRLTYGGTTRKNITDKILKAYNKTNSKLTLLKLHETRLDTILFRTKFTDSLRSAGQTISHGNVFVNNLKVTEKSYQIYIGDHIKLNPTYLNSFKKHVARSMKWPLPPKHLLVNYRTMQILFVDEINQSTLSTLFLYNLRLQKILTNYI